jgi:hypothetical protein
MTTHYDTIIIGAGQKNPIFSSSPKGGGVKRKKQDLCFSQWLLVIDYAGTAMYSA